MCMHACIGMKKDDSHGTLAHPSQNYDASLIRPPLSGDPPFNSVPQTTAC